MHLGPVRHNSLYVYIPPHPISPRFTGQQIYLDRLQSYFKPPNSINQTNVMGQERRRALLYGTGGTGKTQLALKFAEIHSETLVSNTFP